MVAADLTRKEDRDRGIIEVPIKGMAEPLRLLRCVGIYGANASGKSTILLAARVLRWLGTDSSAVSKPDAKIFDYQPFLLDNLSRTAPIKLGCDVVCDESILRYEIVFNESRIQSETLSIRSEKREVKLIEREGLAQVQGRLITNSKANKLYVEEMQPNVTVLSKLAQFGPSQGKGSAKKYYTAIQEAMRFVDYSNATVPWGIYGGTSSDKFADDSNYREWIMNHLIRSADVGICDVTTRRESIRYPDDLREFLERTNGSTKLPDARIVVAFMHKGSVKQVIDFDEESSGTKKLFHLAGDWWRLGNESGTLLADELSASLHPQLLDRLIRAVNDAPSSVQSQLIFTTHDTGLLEGQDGLPPALRRDQVYFTTKNANGVSEIYSLAEFKDDARPVHNIRKRYMSGLYGAIPLVEKLSL